jgi:hypothetical protein
MLPGKRNNSGIILIEGQCFVMQELEVNVGRLTAFHCIYFDGCFVFQQTVCSLYPACCRVELTESLSYRGRTSSV